MREVCEAATEQISGRKHSLNDTEFYDTGNFCSYKPAASFSAAKMESFITANRFCRYKTVFYPVPRLYNMSKVV